MGKREGSLRILKWVTARWQREFLDSFAGAQEWHSEVNTGSALVQVILGKEVDGAGTWSYAIWQKRADAPNWPLKGNTNLVASGWPERQYQTTNIFSLLWNYGACSPVWTAAHLIPMPLARQEQLKALNRYRSKKYTDSFLQLFLTIAQISLPLKTKQNRIWSHQIQLHWALSLSLFAFAQPLAVLFPSAFDPLSSLLCTPGFLNLKKRCTRDTMTDLNVYK